MTTYRVQVVVFKVENAGTDNETNDMVEMFDLAQREHQDHAILFAKGVQDMCQDVDG